MTFLKLLLSILLVSICSHPILLFLAGLFMTIRDGKLEGLFAPLAAPMTLAFFGIPTLTGGLFVIIPTFYLFSRFGRRDLVPFAVFAIGAAVLLYLAIAQPAPTGAIPGYDQTAQGFAAASLLVWAVYAYSRLDLRQG